MNSNLFIIRGNQGLFGYMDKLGNEVIRPQFKNALPFNNNLAIVSIDGKFTIDRNYEVTFSNNHKKRLINPQGQFINDLILFDVYPFILDFTIGYDTNDYATNNLYKISLTGKYEIISPKLYKELEEKILKAYDSEPKPQKFTIFEVENNDIISHSSFEQADEKKYGFKDINGNIIVEPIYDTLYDFSEGLAGFEILGNYIEFHSIQKTRYPNNHDEYANNDDDEYSSFYDEYARYHDEKHVSLYDSILNYVPDIIDRKKVICGFINEKGERVIIGKYYLLGSFNNGLACVQNRFLSWQYIDKTGKIIWENDLYDCLSDAEFVEIEFLKKQNYF